MDFSIGTLSTARLAGVAMQPLSMLSTVNAGAVIDAGASVTNTAATGLGAVSRPVSAAAAGMRTVSPLHTAAKFLGRTLSIVVLGAGVIKGAQIVKDQGAGALIHSKDGRGAVLGALGGGLLLIPTPVTQLGGAGVLTLSAVNEFGLLKFMDRPRSTTTTTTTPTSTTLAQAT